MKRLLKMLRLRRSRPGMLLIEVMVGLTVVAIASIGTGIAFSSAYDQLIRQRHHMSANRFLRAEAEHFMGRIHCDLPDWTTLAARSTREVILDTRGPGTQDDLVAFVQRSPVKFHVRDNVPIANQSNPRAYDFYEFTVTVSYPEPIYASSRTHGSDVMQYSLNAFCLRKSL